jgi:hypothetical protein
MALDDHEAGRRLGDFDEAVAIGKLADLGRAVRDRIERIVGIAVLELLLRGTGGKTFSRPVHRLHRIDAGGNVAVGQQQPEHLIRTEDDVGIEPEQMRELLLGQELHDDLVTAARDQALAMQMQRAWQTEMPSVERHAEDAGDVVHRHRRDVAGRREQDVHGFQGGLGQHGDVNSLLHRLPFTLGGGAWGTDRQRPNAVSQSQGHSMVVTNNRARKQKARRLCDPSS